MTCDSWMPQKPQVMVKVEQSKNAAWQASIETLSDKVFNTEFELGISILRGKSLVLWVSKHRRKRIARVVREENKARGKPKCDRRRREYRGKTIPELVAMGVL